MPVEPNPVKALFLAALDKATAAERATFLDEACAGDADLRQRVEALLRAHGESDQFLDHPAVAVAATSEELTQAVAASSDGSAIAPAAAVAVLEPTHADSHGNGREAGDALALLTPSREPNSLGRLAHYEVLSVVGHGGMGTVFKARDTSLERVVAIKMLTPALAASGTSRKRFEREAKAAAAVTHEHVVNIHAVESAGPAPYLVMEFVGGITLDDRIKQTGPLELKEILRIGMQTASGLAAAHAQGLVHRDVKPSNILLENGVQRVKITDFGLARAVDDASLTKSGVIAGTPLYMSPEQARGEALDHRADLFSLGSVLYTLCTGHPPFRAPNTLAVLKRVCEDTPRPIREINPDIPDWLCAIVGKLLAKEPDQRFQSAADVAELLSQHLAHVQQPQVIPPPPALRTIEPVQRRRHRSPMVLAALALAAAALLFALVGGVVFRMWHQPGPDTPPPGPIVRPTTSPFDDRKREDIPRALLALAGNGDPEQAPPELVAVLGEARFRLPSGDPGPYWMAQSRNGVLAVPIGNQIALYEAATGRLLRILTGHTDRVVSVAFNPDGQRLVSGGFDRTLKVWDVRTGQETLSLPGHTNFVYSVAFSPDGHRIASASWDKTVKVWDSDKGTELHTLQGYTGNVLFVCFSPDGKRLASGSDQNDNTVKVWDVDKGQLVETLKGHTGPWNRAAFSPDGKYLATGSDNELILWNAVTLEKIRTHNTPAGWLAFTPDSKTLFAARENCTQGQVHAVTRWDVAGGKPLPSFTLQSQGGSAVHHLSPDGKTLYAMRGDFPTEPFLHVYDAETGKELFPHQEHEGRVNSVAVSPDGQTLASGGEDHTVRLWNLAGWKAGDALPPVRILNGHTEEVRSVAFSPDGQLLASGSTDSTIILWDVASGKEQRTLTGHSRIWSLLAFSPDGQTVAAGGQDGFVRFWEVKTGAEKTPQRLHTGDVRAVAFSLDGKWLASGGAEGTVQLVETATGRRNIFRPGTTVTNVAFSHDSQTLFAVTDAPNAALRYWNVETKKETLLGGMESNHTLGLAVHPAGELVVTANRGGGVVRVWHLPSRATLVVAGGKNVSETWLDQVAFTPEGRYLVAGNPNGTISVYRTPAPPKPYDPGPPRKLPDPVELAKQPSAADALKRADIPADLLAKAGGSDPNKAPAELVAVLAKDGHNGQVFSVTFSPDAKLLASCGLDKTIKVWDLTTGKLQRTLTGHQDIVRVVVFSPDGKWLASASEDRTIKLWEVVTGEERHTLRGHIDRVFRVAFSPDGQSLASAGFDGRILLWDAGSGRLRRNVGNHGRAWARGVAFSPDGKMLASVGDDQTVRLWDLAQGWETRLPPAHQGLHTAAFHPDGQTLATSGANANLLWDLAAGKVKASLTGHTREIEAIAWRADGRLVVSAGTRDGSVRAWNPNSEPPRSSVWQLFPPDLNNMVHGVAISPEGRYLASANPDGTVYILRLAERGEVYEIPPDPVELQPRAAISAHDGAVTWTAFSTDGKTLASAGKDGVFKLWNVAEQKERWSISAHDGGVRVLAVAPDGKTLATAAFDGIIRLWDADGKQLHELPGHKGGVAPLLFSPAGEQLLSGGADGCVRFWSVRDGKEVHKIDASKDWITHLSLTPDGKTLATSGNDGSVRLWNGETGKERTSLPERSNVCFTPDGKRLAVATPDHQIKLLDADTLEVRAVLIGHTDTPDGLCFSADGKLLASCSADGTIRLWDARRGNLLALARGHKSRVWTVALTADGKTLAAGDEDGKLLLWDVSRLSQPR